MSEHIGKGFKALHSFMFRCGETGLIMNIESVQPEGRAPRDCFRIKYPDGIEDLTPVENEDLSGVRGGEGVFYEIVDV